MCGVQLGSDGDAVLHGFTSESLSSDVCGGSLVPSTYHKLKAVLTLIILRIGKCHCDVSPCAWWPGGVAYAP